MPMVARARMEPFARGPAVVAAGLAVPRSRSAFVAPRRAVDQRRHFRY